MEDASRNSKERDLTPTDDELIEEQIKEALGEINILDFIDGQGSVSEKQPNIAPKQVLKGKITAIHGEDVFVDIGSKDQGIVPLRQFEDSFPKVGDYIDVIVEEYLPEEGIVHLYLPGAVREADWESLEVGQILEGFVSEVLRGGLRLRFGRNLFGFMPASQIDTKYVEDLGEYLHKKLRCKVIRLDRSSREVVVSRRELLEEQLKKDRQRFIDGLAIGKIVEGTVTSIQPYGAFVEIGPAVEGLIHISQISHKKIKDPAEVLSVGEKVKVMVIDVDKAEGKVSLSLKQVKPDPWDTIDERIKPSDIVMGRICNIFDFGCFVELEEGVEGLVPKSEISYDRSVKPSSLKIGQVVKIKVLNIDKERKRILLSIRQAEEEDPWQGSSIRWPVGSLVKGVVSSITKFGVFVRIRPGLEGLVHISEIADRHISNISKILNIGDEVTVKVLSVDEERRRMALSIKQAESQLDDAVSQPQHMEDGRDIEDKQEGKGKKQRRLKGGLDE